MVILWHDDQMFHRYYERDVRIVMVIQEMVRDDIHDAVEKKLRNI